MKVDELEKIINNAFEDRQNVSESSDKKILEAISQTIDLTRLWFVFLYDSICCGPAIRWRILLVNFFD